MSEEDEFAVPIFASVVEMADETALYDGGYMDGTSHQVLMTGALDKSFTVKPKTAQLKAASGVAPTHTFSVGSGAVPKMTLGEVEDRGRKQRLRQKQVNSGQVVPVQQPS